MTKHELEKRVAKEVDEMTLMHDVLMTRVFQDDPGLVEYVLRIMLNRNDLKVVSSEVQKDIFARPEHHSVRLDVVAVDEHNVFHDIEIQRASENFSFKRMRYYQSSIDHNNLGVGENYSKLPETILIFIMDFDYYGDGKPYYRFRLKDDFKGRVAPDSYVWYLLNQKYVDKKSTFGKLMHDFGCAKTEEILLPRIKKSVECCKEGEKRMSVEEDIREMFKPELDQARKEAREKGRKEGREEGRKETMRETILRMKENGFSAEQIALATGWSKAEIEKVK